MHITFIQVCIRKGNELSVFFVELRHFEIIIKNAKCFHGTNAFQYKMLMELKGISVDQKNWKNISAIHDHKEKGSSGLKTYVK